MEEFEGWLISLTREHELGSKDEESTPESDLLSANIRALTPLQLAIYLNLPGIIRLLYTTSSKSSTPSYSSKNNTTMKKMNMDEHR